MFVSPILFLSVLLASEPQGKQIDNAVESARKAWNVPGVALAVVSKDQTLHLKGYGLREIGRKDPITPDTVFPLASCTKAFTTTLAAMLVDEGRLAWDDPVRKHLPDFHLSDPHADALVSLRDLAAHRTGVAAHDLLWYRSPLSQAELVKRAGQLPLSKPFRKDMQYQTVMYLAFGQAVEKAAGKAWSELVAERILDPLQMKGVTLTTADAKRKSELAAGHRLDRDEKLAVVPWYEHKEPNSAGSMNASVRDLAPWLRLQINGGQHNGAALVSEAGLHETHSPQTIIPLQGEAKKHQPESLQMSYGLAWVVQDYRGELVVQHAGLIDGFRVHLTLLPKRGYAFAILANREGTRMNLALSNTIIDLLLGLPAKDWNKYLLDVIEEDTLNSQVQARREDQIRNTLLKPSVTLEQLAGRYDERAYGESHIRLEKGELVWEWGPWKLPMEHYAGDTFRLIADMPLLNRQYLTFDVAEGKAKGYRILGLGFDRK